MWEESGKMEGIMVGTHSQQSKPHVQSLEDMNSCDLVCELQGFWQYFNHETCEDWFKDRDKFIEH